MIELYYFENSICAERPLMTLAEKGVDDWIPHHVHLFKGEQFDPAYLKLNPKAQVPTLVHDGVVIRESSIICDYLDDLYPDPPLKPASRADIAVMLEWIHDADTSGYESVASLSFLAVFRAKLLAMSEEELDAYWAGQTVLERSQRQQSCVKEGFASPYALRAIAAWERAFRRIEDTLSDDRPWIMGEQFTLAEINLAPFIARMDGMQFIEPWIADLPATQAWWQRLKARPSFIEARVGPSGEERETMAREGAKVVGDFLAKRVEYLALYPA